MFSGHFEAKGANMLMSDYWHDMDLASRLSGHDGASLGHEYLMNDAGQVGPAFGASTNLGIASYLAHFTGSLVPPPTLVGSSHGLQIDLVWDSSVTKAPSGFMQAVIDAAQYYTTLIATHEVIKIDVGYGEIGGSPLAANALGESESYGYLTNYSTVTVALSHDGFVFSATNEPTSSQFFLTSAEAKTLGLVNPASGLDGYVGFGSLSGTGFSWNTAASPTGANGKTGPNQFDLQSVALHEISEIMGRIGMEGASVNGRPTDTPLDLFNYQNHGALELSPNGGYFSINDGTTHLGTFNNASANGGDIADWASSTSTTQSNTLGLPSGVNVYDAYDAFGFPGYNGDVSQSDILELNALGYKLTPAGLAAV
jgi:hypothetical protein